MGTIEENLAINLKRLRERRGLSTTELAKEAKVDKGTINKWENQKQGFRRNNLKTVAKALGCSVEDLTSNPPEEAHAAMEKNELFVAIVTALPALNESELRGVLAVIEESASYTARGTIAR